MTGSMGQQSSITSSELVMQNKNRAKNSIQGNYSLRTRKDDFDRKVPCNNKCQVITSRGYETIHSTFDRVILEAGDLLLPLRPPTSSRPQAQHFRPPC